MSDDGYDLTIPAGLSAHSDGQSLYRAIIYDNWLRKNNTEVKHPLFYRLDKDVSGLSVDATAEACRANFQEPIYGLVDMTAGQIREIAKSDGDPLDVIPTTATHSNIKKIPYRDDDRIEATRIAKELAKRANVHEHYRLINSPMARYDWLFLCVPILFANPLLAGSFCIRRCNAFQLKSKRL